MAPDFCLQGLAAQDELGKLTINDLKGYCKSNWLTRSGTKKMLVQRIKDHVMHEDMDDA